MSCRSSIGAVALLATLVVALPPRSAPAYSLATTVSESCHERITAASVILLRELAEIGARIEVPDNPLLKRLLRDTQIPGLDSLSEGGRFIVLSLIVGVRSPDTEGHSTLNLSALRRLHADPDARGQYAHALRGPADDGLLGDIAAVDGTIGAVIDELRLGVGSLTAEVIVEKPFFMDHYGQVQIPVIALAWHVGRAVHALQDAHAHMVWDAEVRHVVHVLNYVDAVEGRLSAGRDGMAHSDALDDCGRDDVAPLVERATARTAALLGATLAYVQTGDEEPLRRGFTPCPDDATRPGTCGWLVYNPPCRAALAAGDEQAIGRVCCVAANDFCGSPYVSIAREDPAGPYLGCAAAPGRGGPVGLWPLGLLVLGGWLRRRARPAGGALVAGFVGALLLMAPVEAEAETGSADAYGPDGCLHVALEGHGSLLDDRIDSAILAPSLGYGVRAGWRWGRWRVGLLVERNHWVSLEYGARVDAGVVDAALFGDLLLFDGFVRLSLALGTSVLLFDTRLHDAGAVGGFGELRPAGLRWNPSDDIYVVFDPLTLAVLVPGVETAEAIPSLRKVQRRTVVAVEATFF